MTDWSLYKMHYWIGLIGSDPDKDSKFGRGPCLNILTTIVIRISQYFVNKRPLEEIHVLGLVHYEAILFIFVSHITKSKVFLLSLDIFDKTKTHAILIISILSYMFAHWQCFLVIITWISVIKSGLCICLF